LLSELLFVFYFHFKFSFVKKGFLVASQNAGGQLAATDNRETPDPL